MVGGATGRPGRRSRRSRARSGATRRRCPTGCASTASRRRTRRATPHAAASTASCSPRSSSCKLSIRDMADVLERSPTTVRHWLRRHALETPQMARDRLGRAALAAGLSTAEIPCPRHGMTRHVRRKEGFRCARCRVEHVADKRRRIKRQLVLEAGGRCELCGYDRCLAALQFHHVDRPQALRAQPGGGLARDVQGARRGGEVRAAVRQLSCRGRGGAARFP